MKPKIEPDLEKKPQRRKNFWNAVSELLLELVFTIAALAIGYGIFRLFGRTEPLETMDSELLELVGAVVLIVAIGIVAVIVNKIRKNRHKNEVDQ